MIQRADWFKLGGSCLQCLMPMQSVVDWGYSWLYEDLAGLNLMVVIWGTFSWASHWILRLFTGDWVQRRRAQEQIPRTLRRLCKATYKLALEVMCHHLCYTLLVKHESQQPREIQGIRKHGSLEDLPLAITYHGNLGQFISILCPSFSPSTKWWQ